MERDESLQLELIRPLIDRKQLQTEFGENGEAIYQEIKAATTWKTLSQSAKGYIDWLVFLKSDLKMLPELALIIKQKL